MINWSNLFKHNNIDIKISTFYVIIMSPVQSYVPTYEKYSTSFPIWFSKELKILIKSKRNLDKYVFI